MITSGQRKILTYMAAHRREGSLNTQWIAEGCDHWYDSAWATSRLSTLKKHGLVESPQRGQWSITDLGLKAL